MEKKIVLFNYLMRFVGLPYIWGGKTPIKGMDCSGIVCEFLQAYGHLKSHEELKAQQLFDRFYNNNQFKPEFGSLCFFGQTSVAIGHVGIALNDFFMVEAGSGDQTTTDPDKAAKMDAFVRIRPIKSRKDLYAIVTPAYCW
jgi:cell wall-associated NlpC family hydrolase